MNCKIQRKAMTKANAKNFLHMFSSALFINNVVTILSLGGGGEVLQFHGQILMIVGTHQIAPAMGCYGPL